VKPQLFNITCSVCDDHNIILCSMFMLCGRTYSAGKMKQAAHYISCDAPLACARRCVGQTDLVLVYDQSVHVITSLWV